MKTTPKNFTLADKAEGQYSSIYADRSELLYAPTKWQKMGLQETASGYGRKLNSGYKIQFEGKFYRIYISCFSNTASHWFQVKGRTIYVN